MPFSSICNFDDFYSALFSFQFNPRTRAARGDALQLTEHDLLASRGIILTQLRMSRAESKEFGEQIWFVCNVVSGFFSYPLGTLGSLFAQAAAARRATGTTALECQQG